MDPIIEDYFSGYRFKDDSIDIDFSDLAFSYDYNEVQELYFDQNVNNVILLAGKTGLRKKDMLARVCQDLELCGVSRNSILCIDFDIPAWYGEDVFSIIGDFYHRRASIETPHVIINEIHVIDGWFDLLTRVHGQFPTLKILASSSVPSEVYESVYSSGLDYYKVIVLSEKNDSNIKYRTQSFGVFREFKYNIKNNTVEIKGLTKEGKKMPSHLVPAEIDGFPVKIIASGAFHDRSEMENIVLPDTIEMIGDYAFSKCSGLTEIGLPDSLTYIGDHSFLGSTKLSRITGGSNVLHIGNSAFFGTKWLDLQGDMVVLGKVLYRYRGSEKRVSVPESVETLAPFCFSRAGVEAVSGTVTLSEEGIFYKCRQLKCIDLKIKDVPALTFFGCDSLNMEISADNIGKFAFFGCSSLRSATAGNVGQSAFAFCSKLSHVGSLVEVSDGAFWNCENLETVDLSNVKTIGAFSFGRSFLKNVEIKASRMKDFAFCMIQSLESFSIMADCCIGYRILYRSDSLKSMSIAGRFKIPSYFGYMPPMLAKVNVEGDICDDFCRSCNSLRSLSISNADHFGRWSFYDCPNLSDAIIENVKTIGDWAFAHCSHLEEIRLPPSVSFIGMNAFRYCNNLRKIRIDSKKAISFGPNALYSTHPDKVIQVSGNLLGDYEKMEVWKDYFSSMTRY